MASVTFKNYTFQYDSNQFNYFIDENSLTFFHSEYEVGIHISIANDRLFLRPRYGVTIQRLTKGKYHIISNSN